MSSRLLLKILAKFVPETMSNVLSCFCSTTIAAHSNAAMRFNMFSGTSKQIFGLKKYFYL